MKSEDVKNTFFSVLLSFSGFQSCFLNIIHNFLSPTFYLRVLNSNFQENKNTECNSDVYDKQMRFLHMTIGMSKILTIEVLINIYWYRSHI